MSEGGSRYLKEPFLSEHRIAAIDRIMGLQFGTMEKRLERIEGMIAGLERRLWMAVYGVVAVFLIQAVQSILEFAPKGGGG